MSNEQANAAAQAARKATLLRLDPQVYHALAQWASDDNRSVNAQIEILLRQALFKAGRAPKHARPLRGPGRPRTSGAPEVDAKPEPPSPPGG